MPRIKHQERGIALLMVISMIALVTSVVAEFQYSSRVDYQLAINARDELQAEYNALSAIRLRTLLIKQSKKLQMALGGLLQMFTGADAASGNGATPQIGQILDMIPVECGMMSAITQATDKEESNDDEGFFPGECSAKGFSEHAKISVNLLRNNVNDKNVQVATLLVGLLNDIKFKHFFEEDDDNGTHAQNSQELIGAITDWIDSDRVNAITRTGDEDRYYDTLKDSYSNKNAPFDSTAEIQLVYGIHDDMYDLLKDHITIYNDSSRIDLATSPIERILMFALPACLIPGASLEMLLNHPGLGMLAQRIMAARQLQASFMPINVALLKTWIQELGLTNLIDSNKLSEVFSDSTSTTWYTIDGYSKVGNASHHIKTVFQSNEGQFYYFRIE